VRPYRLLSDDLAGSHLLGVGGLAHGHGGRVPGTLLGGLRLVRRLEPTEHCEELLEICLENRGKLKVIEDSRVQKEGDGTDKGQQNGSASPNFLLVF
jgi:hypothetical protein